MKIKLYPPQAICELGQRDNQEDFIYPAVGNASPNDSLFLVCDGMGGHEHGEVASSTFATSLAKFFEARVSPDIVLPDTTIADAIDHAYVELDKADDGNFRKMGTTLTMLYFHRGGVTAAHIGDSRIYHIRPSKGLLYVSRDHSLVFDLYQSGELTYDEMKNSSQKNVITRAVQPGEENRVKPDIIHITDVQPGDYFYLCSDGMLEQMEDDELLQLLSAKGSDEKKRQQLIASTVDNKDNHSAYLIHVEAVTNEADDTMLGENEEKTSRCNALNIQPVKLANSIEDEDVAMMPPPYHPHEQSQVRKNNIRKWGPILLLAALVMAAGIYLFNGKNKTPNEGEGSIGVRETTYVDDTVMTKHAISREHHSGKKHDSSAAKETDSKVMSAPNKSPVDSPKMKIDPSVIKKLPPKSKMPTDKNKSSDSETKQEPEYHHG